MAFDAQHTPHDERTRKLLGVIDELEENIRRFQRGELTPEQFRPLRLAMGVYAQLAHVKHMQRVKIPGGRMTADQVDALAEMTERWGRGLAHVTTRQDLQIHHLEITDAPDVQRLLAKAGISTLGACMDTVRNVTASPYAGVLPDEVFDVTPHAEAIDRHFTFHALNRKLPRKFKIGIAGSPRDQVLARINDVGLFAREKDGVRGFRMYVAGGLGATPELAHLWLDFVPEDDVLLAIEAVLAVFHRDGDRKNRKKNRLKFLLRKVGAEELLGRFDAELTRLRDEQGECLAATFRGLVADYAEAPPPPTEPASASLGDAAFARWKRSNTEAQAQPGYRTITIKLPLGDITAPQLRRVADLARLFGNTEIRATVTQNLVLRFVPEQRLYALYRQLRLVDLAEPDADHVTDVVSCPGADYCSLAITKSMGLGARVREHMAALTAAGDALVGEVGALSVKVSGCPNSCGQHHIAEIGLTGLMVTGKDGVERPHYSIRVGGGGGEDATLGERLFGRVPEEEAPKVIAALARHYVAERAPGERFRDYAARLGVDTLSRVGLGAAEGVV